MTYGELDVVVLVLLAVGAVTHSSIIIRRPRDGRRLRVRTVAFELVPWPSIALLILSQLAGAGDRPVPTDSLWWLIALMGALALLLIVLAYRTFVTRR